MSLQPDESEISQFTRGFEIIIEDIAKKLVDLRTNDSSLFIEIEKYIESAIRDVPYPVPAFHTTFFYTDIIESGYEDKYFYQGGFWLGPGIYFWQEGKSIAKWWGGKKKAESPNKSSFGIFNYDLLLESCLDFLDRDAQRLIGEFSNILHSHFHNEIPVKFLHNQGPERYRDYILIRIFQKFYEFIYSPNYIDSVRGAFNFGNLPDPIEKHFYNVHFCLTPERMEYDPEFEFSENNLTIY